MRTVIPLALVFALLTAPAGAQQEGINGKRALTLDQIVPPSAYAYAAFAGVNACSEAAAELNFYRLFQEPEVQAFLGGFLGMYAQIAAETPPEMQQQWDMAREHLGGRIELVVGGSSGIGIQDMPIAIPIPGVLLALDVGGKQASAKALYEQLMGMAESELARELDGFRRETASFSGHPLEVFEVVFDDGPKLTIATTFIENLLVVGLGRHLVEDCIERARGRNTDNLASSASFRRCRSKSAGLPLVEFFVDAHRIGNTVLSPFLTDELKAELGKLGIADIQACYWATAVHDGDTFDTLYFDAPAPRRGLLALAGGQSLDGESLRVVPRDALAFLACRMDMGQAWDLVLDTMTSLERAGQMPSDVLEEMEEGLAEAREALGFDLRGDLLAALGPEVVAYIDWPQGRLFPAAVISVQLADREKATRIIQNLLSRAPVRVSVKHHGGHDLHLVTVPREEIPLSPCFAIVGDKLVLSLTIQGLKGAVDRLAGQSADTVLAQPNFREAFNGLPLGDAALVGYFDIKRLLSLGYDFVENMAPGMIGSLEGLPIDPAKVPSAETVLRHFKSWGFVGFGDADGIGMQSRSLGLASLLAGLGRFVTDAPGCPMYVFPRLGATFDGGDAAPRAIAGQAPQAQSAIVNPLKPGDPAEAEVKDRIEQISQAIAQNPGQGNLYFARGIDWNRIRRYGDAAHDFQKALELGFQPQTCAYNTCCAFSLKGDGDQALKWLARAFELGFESWNHIDNDSDLDSIRKDPRFAALVRKYRD